MTFADDHLDAAWVVLGVANHHAADAARYLLCYRKDSGYAYLQHVPCTPPDRLVLEDLARRSWSTRVSARPPRCPRPARRRAGP
jgi:hypothetical protein